MSLPNNAQDRKETPLYSGVLLYFPDALAEVARVSWLGNQQHNPGEPLHWAREKSTDQMDCVIRHAIDHGTGTTRDDGGKTWHLAKAAWRVLAELQLSIEKEQSCIKTDPSDSSPQTQRVDGSPVLATGNQRSG